MFLKPDSMKSSIIIGILLTLGNSIYSQNHFLNDTLIKKVSVFDDDTIYNYFDFDGSYDELSLPKDINGNVPEVIGFNYNPESQIINLAEKIFDLKELKTLINSKCIIKCISTSSGKVVSVSFKFSEREPKICLDKFVKFSQQFKEKITIETIFSEKIAEEGYIQSSYGLFLVLKKHVGISGK
jgi:hypothetical protein